MMMLDILANNDWKRPIYFSGGSFDDAEFIWMKDYLQLDGLVYKLVPIKTERENGFDMGRIDEELMYAIVKSWDWGNSGDTEIYHDTQTRIQGVTFRSNLARLIEKLIQENKIEKAKEIIEIALTNMPIDQFGYYSLVEPYIDAYYQVGETTKARELYQRLRGKYHENLEYYISLPIEEKVSQGQNILSDMEAYNRLVDILVINKDRELAEKETLIFNEYFDKFYGDQFENPRESAVEPDSDLNDVLPINDSASFDTINNAINSAEIVPDSNTN